jgi:CBS domain-containing protein
VIDSLNNKFIGVLDLRDTVKFALETYRKQSTALSEQKQKAMEYLTSSPQISTQSLKYLSQMRKFRTVLLSDSLMPVISSLAQGSHVIGVIDDQQQNKLIGVITQGQFFQQVCAKLHASVFNNTDGCSLQQLLDLKYVTSPVKSIKSSVKAYEAFELMSKLDLSGLAVVNNDGVLIHNTSATDIKLWLIHNASFEDSIEQFLINIRKLALTERFPITVCTLDDSLRRALQKLQATKYHRLWIVDPKTQPVGVFALTDFFKFIIDAKKK